MPSNERGDSRPSATGAMDGNEQNREALSKAVEEKQEGCAGRGKP